MMRAKPYYLPPEKLRRMPFKPTGFARKIVEVNPKLMVAFAGNAAIALQFAERIRDWFLNCDVTNDFIIQFLTTYYSTKLPNFGAIIGAMLPDRFQSYWIGDTASGTSERWGNFVVADSGMELFVDLVCPGNGPTTTTTCSSGSSPETPLMSRDATHWHRRKSKVNNIFVSLS
jgi:hypothetical protein